VAERTIVSLFRNRTPAQDLPLSRSLSLPLSLIPNLILTLCLSLPLAACGGSTDGPAGTGKDDPVPAGPVASVQDELAEADFWTRTADDAALAGLKDGLVAAGFSTFVTAGVLAEDGGASLEFAAYGNEAGAERAAVRHCSAGDCVRAVAEVVDGRIAWTGPDGAPLAVRPIAVPHLLRQTKTQKPADGTVVVSPLETPAPAEPVTLDLTKRRLVLVSRFGGETGLPAAGLGGALATSGRFDEVVVSENAPAEAFRTALSTAHPHEVVVLVAQGLRQLALDNKDPALREYRTLGLLARSGVYGSTLLDAASLAGAGNASPLTGPGVLLLVGGETIGDGSKSMGKAGQATTAAQLRFPGHVVAGFVHSAAPQVLAEAARRFLEALGDGDTAATARDRVNAVLEGWGVAARLAFTEGSDEAYRLPGPAVSFWGDRVPASADLSLYLHLRLYCANKYGKQVAVEESQGNPAFEGVAFEGPVFRGTREIEFGPGQFHRATVLGMLGELREGAHFYFSYTGDVKDGYTGLTLYANAEITAVVEKNGETRVSFRGGAEALPFPDAQGTTCTLPDTDLEPMLEGSGESRLVLHW
jgi:hypothetical protein